MFLHSWFETLIPSWPSVIRTLSLQTLRYPSCAQILFTPVFCLLSEFCLQCLHLAYTELHLPLSTYNAVRANILNVKDFKKSIFLFLSISLLPNFLSWYPKLSYNLFLILIFFLRQDHIKPRLTPQWICSSGWPFCVNLWSTGIAGTGHSCLHSLIPWRLHQKKTWPSFTCIVRQYELERPWSHRETVPEELLGWRPPQWLCLCVLRDGRGSCWSPFHTRRPRRQDKRTFGNDRTGGH